MAAQFVRYEGDDFEGEDRMIVRTPKGRAAVLPKSARRLSGDALEVYAELMATGLQVAELEARIEQLASDARDLGVSWSLIGAAVGVTAEGARKRYGETDE